MVLLLALAHLPAGWLLWRALGTGGRGPGGEDRPTETAPPDLLEELFGALGLALAVSGWLALVLAELGAFTLWRLGALWLPPLLVAGWRARRLGIQIVPVNGAPARPAPLIALALASWLALAGWLYFRPHEYVLGAADAGVYVNLGAQIARSGRLIIDDPLLAELPPALYPALLRPLPPPEATPYYLFPGFYVPGEPPGQIVPQFYPLYPVWLAVGHALGGVGAALRLAGLWAALGGLALFLLARRLGGPQTAALLLAGLTLSGLQLWFARYPTTETLAQYQLWTGVWAAGIWWEAPRRRRAWGLLAALAWGGLLLTRIDMVFVLTLPGALLVLAWWRGRLDRSAGWFVVPLLLLAAHSLGHALWQSWPYFFNTYGAGLRLLERNPGALVAGVLLPFAFLAWLGWRRRRGPDGAAGTTRLAPLGPPVLAAGIVLLTAYAWFVRPIAGDIAPAWISWYAGDEVPVLDRENLVRLGWYLSPAGIWLGALGAALRVARPPRRRRLAWALTLAAGGFFALFYLWRLQNNPSHIYAMRRYVPAVMPFFLLFGAWLLVRLGEGTSRSRLALAALLTVAWFVGLAQGARGLITQVDARGLVAQIDALAGTLAPGAILLFDDPAPIGSGDFLGTPLRFLHDRPSFNVRDVDGLLDAGLAPRFVETVRRWQADGRDVYWVGDPARAGALGLSAGPVRAATVRAQVLEGSIEHRPAAIVERAWDLTISEIEPP